MSPSTLPQISLIVKATNIETAKDSGIQGLIRKHQRMGFEHEEHAAVVRIVLRKKGTMVFGKCRKSGSYPRQQWFMLVNTTLGKEAFAE